MSPNELPTLTLCLQRHSWRQLLAIMATHGLASAAQQRKPDLIQLLEQQLQEPTTLQTIIAQLDATSQNALQALLASAGQLPAHRLEQGFGPRRPYRPWDKAATLNAAPPWQAPLTATERLWYLGLIYLNPPKPQPGVLQHYVLPAEIYNSLQQARASPPANIDHPRLLPPGRPADLVVHLGVWLATLAANPVKLVRGGWLPPSLLATLAARLGLAQERSAAPPQSAGVMSDFPLRSERHHPYLAFLHYLAVAAEWVSPATNLALTPQGWSWLAAATAERWQQLWQAWLTAADELAAPYAFDWEPLPRHARTYLLTRLQHLPQDHFAPLPALLEQWRLQDSYGHLPAPRPSTWLADAPVHDPLVALCTGPLHWLGLLELTHPGSPAPAFPATPLGSPPAHPGPWPPDLPLHLRLTRQGAWLLASPGYPAPAFPPPALCTLPKTTPATLLAPSHVQPLHLAQLAPFCQWQPWPDGRLAHALTLDGARIAQAVALGVTTAQVMQQVGAALGRPPSRRLRQQLRRWAQAGQQVQLRPLLVLETATPELLAQLRRHKLVRRRLGEGLAPNRVALNPLDVAPLLQTLRTLGHYVAAPPASLAAINTAATTLTADPAADQLAPAWQWLLVQLYEQLGQLIDLPLRPPWAIQQRLQAQLSPLQQAAATASVTHLIQQLTRALDGYLALPAWATSADAGPPDSGLPDSGLPDSGLRNLLPRLQAAITAGHDLTLHYAGASRGNLTTRRVTPFRLEERHGVPYLIAWCHLRQAERVFRVDRIVGVESLES